MKKLIKQLFVPLLMLGIIAVPQASVYAAPTTPPATTDKAFEACGTSTSPVCASTSDTDVNNIVKTVVNTLIYILGAIAVIMVVVGGIRYTTSNGDASGIKSAKDTILYAIIGIIVALLAYTIVNFVLGQF